MNPHSSARLAAVMARHGLSAMVASSPENLHYTTGHWSIGSQILRSSCALAVVGKDGQRLALILSCGDVANFVDAGFDPEQIYAYGTFFFEGAAPAQAVQSRTSQAAASPTDALARALTALDLTAASVGLDESQLPMTAWPDLGARFPHATFKPANSVFREARMVKSPAEVRRLERAAEIAEDALLAALGKVHAGMTERELAGLFEAEVGRRGGRPFFTVVTFGERSALADTPPTDRALARGDLMRFDVGAVFEGYRSDIARTAVLGPPTEKVRRYYDAMLQGEDAAIAAARPGVRALDIFDTAVGTVRRAGVGHYRRQHVGHTIGLEVYDSFAVEPGQTTPLEAGMVLCLETPYYELGWGGVQVEDLVEITAEGARLLNKSSRELIILSD